MGFPLAALKLRLKRFCEVLVARSSLGPHYIKNRHLSLSRLILIFDPRRIFRQLRMMRRGRPSAVVQRVLLNRCKGEMMSSRRAAVSIERKFTTRMLGRPLGQRQSSDWTWLAVHKY